MTAQTNHQAAHEIIARNYGWTVTSHGTQADYDKGALHMTIAYTPTGRVGRVTVGTSAHQLTGRDLSGQAIARLQRWSER